MQVMSVRSNRFSEKDLEAATGGVLQKKVFLEISQNSPENTSAKARYRCFPVNCKTFLRNLFYRTPPGDCFSRLTAVPLTNSYHQFYF